MAPVANIPGSESSCSSLSSSSSEEFHEDIIPRTSGTIPPVPKTGHVSSKMQKWIKKGEVVNRALMKQKSLKDKRARALMQIAGNLRKRRSPKILVFITGWSVFVHICLFVWSIFQLKHKG